MLVNASIWTPWVRVLQIFRTWLFNGYIVRTQHAHLYKRSLFSFIFLLLFLLYLHYSWLLELHISLHWGFHKPAGFQRHSLFLRVLGFEHLHHWYKWLVHRVLWGVDVYYGDCILFVFVGFLQMDFTVFQFTKPVLQFFDAFEHESLLILSQNEFFLLLLSYFLFFLLQQIDLDFSFSGQLSLFLPKLLLLLYGSRHLLVKHICLLIILLCGFLYQFHWGQQNLEIFSLKLVYFVVCLSKQLFDLVASFFFVGVFESFVVFTFHFEYKQFDPFL